LIYWRRFIPPRRRLDASDVPPALTTSPARTLIASAALAALLAGGALLQGSAAEKPLFTIDDYFLAASLSVQDMTRDGAWLACSIGTNDDRLPQDNARYGDPTYIGPSQADLVVVETATGKQTRVLSGKAQFRSPAWSEDGRLLAFLLRRGDGFQPVVWDRETGRMTDIALPKGRILDPGSPIAWSPDGRRLFFALKAPDWAQRCRALFDRITRGPILVMDTDEPFLEWDALRRLGRLSIPAALDRTTGRWTELLPETMIISQRLTRDGKALIFERDMTEKTDYDVIGGTRNQLEVLALVDGAPPRSAETNPRILLKPYDRRSFSWSRDGRTFAWADKGDVYKMSLDDAEPRLIVGEKPGPEQKEGAAAPADKPTLATEPEAKPKPKKQSFSVMRLSPDGSQILCSSTRPEPEPEADPDTPGVTPKPKPAPAAAAARRPSPPRQFWLVDVKTKERRLVFEFPEDEDKRPELQVVDWSPDGRAVYFSYSATDGYDRGLVKLDLASKAWTDLRRSDRLASRWRFSGDGSTVVFMESDGDAPDELHAADAGCAAVRTLTDLNPELRGKALSHTELVSYRDTDGRKLHGVLYYPAHYERGKTYPMVTEVYEQLLRQRLQRRPQRPDLGRLRRPPPQRQPGDGLPGRGLGQGRPGRDQQGHRHGRRRSRPARDPGHELRRLRDRAAHHPDRPVQGGHQQLGQGQHGELLHAEPSARRPQHPRPREEPGPDRRDPLGIPGAVPGPFGDPAGRPDQDAAPVHHGRPRPERRGPAVPGDLLRAAAAGKEMRLAALHRAGPTAARTPARSARTCTGG
jgi:dipeptidyl aminopeptidase/acylaminoacyl peptidase